MALVPEPGRAEDAVEEGPLPVQPLSRDAERQRDHAVLDPGFLDVELQRVRAGGDGQADLGEQVLALGPRVRRQGLQPALERPEELLTHGADGG